jgi:hypothetical protein
VAQHLCGNGCSGGRGAWDRITDLPITAFIVAIVPKGGTDVAFFLPFGRNKGRQMAAKSNTKRKTKTA